MPKQCQFLLELTANYLAWVLFNVIVLDFNANWKLLEFGMMGCSGSSYQVSDDGCW